MLYKKLYQNNPVRVIRKQTASQDTYNISLDRKNTLEDEFLLLIDEDYDSGADNILDIVIYDNIPDAQQNNEYVDNIKYENNPNREYTRKSVEQDLAEIYLLDELDNDTIHTLKTTASKRSKYNTAETILDLSDSYETKLEDKLELFLDKLVFEEKDPTLPLRAYSIDNISSIGIENKEPQAYEVGLYFQKDRNVPTSKDLSIKRELFKILQKWASINKKDIEFKLSLGK